MASYSAIKIRIARDTYENFFAAIRAGEQPGQPVTRPKSELESLWDSWGFVSPGLASAGGQPVTKPAGPVTGHASQPSAHSARVRIIKIKPGKATEAPPLSN